MRCPYCRQNIRIQGRFCPACGEQIFGLPVERPRADRSAPTQPSQPAQPSRPAPPRPTTPPTYSGRSPDSGPADIDIELDSDEPARAPTTARTGAQPATAEYVGKICPYCRFPIKPGQDIVVCPACKVPHHAECWQENNGCTTYGCTGTITAPPSAIPPPIARQPQPPGPFARPIQAPYYLEGQVEELNKRANTAMWLSILGIFCCPILAIIGFIMGIVVLGEVSRSRSMAYQPARGRAIAAIVIAGFGMLISLAMFISGAAQS
jgi:hypothetical protein